MPSALSVVRGNECKIIMNEKNAVQFCGYDARSLAVGNYSCCTDSTYQQYFGIVKLKNDLNPFQIGIYLLQRIRFSASRTFFRRLNPEKKFGQAGLAEFFFGGGG